MMKSTCTPADKRSSDWGNYRSHLIPRLFRPSPKILKFFSSTFCSPAFCGSMVPHSSLLRFDILRFCGSAVRSSMVLRFIIQGVV